MTRNRTYFFNNPEDRLALIYDLALHFSKTVRRGRGEYYFWSQPPNEEFDDFGDDSIYDTIEQAFSNLSSRNLIGVKAANRIDGLLLLFLLNFIYKCHVIRAIYPHWSVKKCLNIVFDYMFSNLGLEELDAQTLPQIITFMVLIFIDVGNYRSYHTVAEAKEASGYLDSMIETEIWTGEEIFQAIQELYQM